MQRTRINVALALFLAASLLLALAAASSAQGPGQMGDKWKNGKMWSIDSVYHTVLVTDMSDKSVVLNILNSAVKTKDGNVTSMSLATPIPIQYFYANDTAIVALKNETKNRTGRLCPARTDYSNATIGVAGASAVLAVKNFTITKRDRNTTDLQFSSFSVYLPDGTVKSYKLDTPVRAVKSWSNRTTTISGNPQFRADLQDAFKGGAKFPANAAPVKIKDIDAKIQ